MKRTPTAKERAIVLDAVFTPLEPRPELVALEISGEYYQKKVDQLKQPDGLGKYFPKLPQPQLIVLTIFLMSGIWCQAQRGTMSFVTSPEPTSSSITLPALAPATNNQLFLVWDNPPGASNKISWGFVRNHWTNGSAIIRSNRFPVTNGTAYKVTAMVSGVESIPALWPSNRIAELWLQGSGTNFTGGTNIVRLSKFTNTPPGNMQFWGVANITTGWE